MNYRDKRPKKPNNTKNKVSKVSLKVLQENEYEPREIVNNHEEIENSYPEINFENENETLEQFNQKLLHNYQNASIRNKEMNPQMNDSYKQWTKSQKKKTFCSPRANFNCGKLFAECKG